MDTGFLSQKKKLTDSLNSDYEAFTRIINYLPSAVFIFSFQGKLLEYNDRASILALPIKLNSGDYHFNTLWQEMGFLVNDQFLNNIPKQLSRDTIHAELFRDSSRGKLCYQLQTFPLGQMDYFVVQLTDNTAHWKKLEESQLERKKAEENDRLKTIFLANMSHEIRTPLNSIIGFSELLLEQQDFDAESHEYVEMIQSAGDTLLQLINDIIDISKIEAGQIKTVKSLVDVHAVLDELALTLANIQRNRGKTHINVEVIKPALGTPLYLETDPNRFRQIFTNLITNALKFVDDGYIKFGYTEITQDFIQFFVKDSGIGIEADKAPHIFQRFAKFDSPQGHNSEGTGLGLSITKQLVELLGGKIWFDTAYKQGSTFYFTLPLTQNRNNIPTLLTPELHTDWSKEVFLIVDDVEANYLFYKSMMKRSGAILLWAKNGDDAIKQCKSNPSISLILMDVMMPYLDGYETTRRIKDFKSEVPVIAQTAFADQHGKEKALLAGCDDYITKPIQQTELISVINRLLYHK